MRGILGSAFVALALGAVATLFAEELPGKIDVVIVEPSSSSMVSSNSADSGNSSAPESSSSVSVESGSSQGGDTATPGSSAGTAAIRRVDAPSVMPKDSRWFDLKGRQWEKKPAASGTYANDGKIRAVK